MQISTFNSTTLLLFNYKLITKEFKKLKVYIILHFNFKF